MKAEVDGVQHLGLFDVGQQVGGGREVIGVAAGSWGKFLIPFDGQPSRRLNGIMA
jgi:hypothetical protein